MSGKKRVSKSTPMVQEVTVEKPKKDWIETVIEKYQEEEIKDVEVVEELPKKVRKIKTVRVGHPDKGWVWMDIEE